MTGAESHDAHRNGSDVRFSGAYKTGRFVRSRQGLASRRSGKQIRTTHCMRVPVAGASANSDRSFAGSCGSFAEYRVSAGRIGLKIPPLKDDYHLLKETHMNTLSSKLTAFAAALAMNGFVFGALGYLFVLQAQPNVSAIAFAKALVA
jgi:hypothetical protein